MENGTIFPEVVYVCNCNVPPHREVFPPVNKHITQLMLWNIETNFHTVTGPWPTVSGLLQVSSDLLLQNTAPGLPGAGYWIFQADEISWPLPYSQIESNANNECQGTVTP